MPTNWLLGAKQSTGGANCEQRNSQDYSGQSINQRPKGLTCVCSLCTVFVEISCIQHHFSNSSRKRLGKSSPPGIARVAHGNKLLQCFRLITDNNKFIYVKSFNRISVTLSYLSSPFHRRLISTSSVPADIRGDRAGVGQPLPPPGPLHARGHPCIPLQLRLPVAASHVSTVTYYKEVQVRLYTTFTHATYCL